MREALDSLNAALVLAAQCKKTGRTAAIAAAAKAAGGLVLTANGPHASSLRLRHGVAAEPAATVLMRGLVGRSGPVLWDHYALELLWQAAAVELKCAEARQKRLHSIIDSAQTAHESLQCRAESLRYDLEATASDFRGLRFALELENLP